MSLTLSTIDEVLSELDAITDTTIGDNSPLGIFAFVYRRTTAKIKEGIEEDRFDDSERMEQFDVEFARKYINAFWNYRNGRPVSYSWEVAFGTALGTQKGDPTILQHLLLGMNAHINLDLGIAAAETAPGNQIEELRDDFMIINDLLAELVDEVQERISRVSPFMFLLDWVGDHHDEAIVNFSIKNARTYAWNVARALADATPDEKEEIISSVDEEIAGLGNLVAHPPGFLLPKVISFIRFFEEKDVRNTIEVLRS